MLRFSRTQLERLGSEMLPIRADDIARRLKLDFPDELATTPETELRATVRLLVASLVELGFRQPGFIYTLTAWGVFLGEDYLARIAKGEPMRIAHGSDPEEERYANIRALVARDWGGA